MWHNCEFYHSKIEKKTHFRDRGSCPGILLLPSSRDNGTPGQENFFVSGQKDNGTSRPVETLKRARLLYFCMYLYNVVSDFFIFPCGYLNLQSYECVRWMISENWKTASRSSLAMSVGQSQYCVKIISGSEFQKDFLFFIFYFSHHGYFSKIISSKMIRTSNYQISKFGWIW